MRVAHFERQPITGVPGRNSIERLFDAVRARLPEDCTPIVVHCPTPAHSPFWIWRGFRTARKVKADVNHIVGDVHYVALALPGARTILTVHDLGHLEGMRGIRRALYRWLYYSWPLQRCKIVTAVSAHTSDQLIARFPSVAHKVRVVPDCYPESFLPHPLRFNDRRPTILQVGTRREKNLERLSEALRNIPCSLRIIGRLTEEQERLLRQNEIAFQALMNLTDDEVLQEYIDADLVVFASTGEGFGMPIIEAQAIGRPLVTSWLSPMKEVAGPGACVVDPFSVADIRKGVLEIIHNPEFREKLIESGLRNARHYSSEAVSAAYADLYRLAVDDTSFAQR